MKEKLGMLMVYGDSTQKTFYNSIRNKKNYRETFTTFKNEYLWNYKRYFDARPHYDGKDYNETKCLTEIEDSMLSEPMMNSSSVFLINFGLHPLMTVSLNQMIHLFESFLKMVVKLRKKYGESLPQVIWRNTTPPTIENTKKHNITRLRFLSKHRVHFWNCYTRERLGEVGVPMLEVHELALSCPPSGYKDHVHYAGFVFKHAEEKLLEYVSTLR